MHFHLSTKHQYSNKNQGFTILEVLVTAAIIGIITAVVAFKYGSFNNAVLLKNQAYEIALNIREAQIIAVSSLGQQSGPEVLEFREDYGIYFNTATESQKQQYLLFQDRGDLIENGQNVAYYDTDPYDEKIGVPLLIDSRFVIDKICVNITDSSNTCPTEVEDLSISFRRPNFDAQFASEDGRSQGAGSINNARIAVTSAYDNNTSAQSVVVNNTGQIYVASGDASDVYFDGTPPPPAPPPATPPPAPPAPPPAPPPSSGGGTVICTELHRQGLISDEMMLADNKFGATVSPYTLKGYHFWAKPIVKLMQDSRLVTAIVGVVAKPWVEEMAYQVGYLEESSLIGKLMMAIGIPLSWSIGVTISAYETSIGFLTSIFKV